MTTAILPFLLLLNHTHTYSVKEPKKNVLIPEDTITFPSSSSFLVDFRVCVMAAAPFHFYSMQ